MEEYKTADKLYHDVERLSGKEDFSEQEEDKMNHKALSGFRYVIHLMDSGNIKNDSVSFFCHLKIGILEHYFENVIPAKEAYIKSIALKKALPSFADSFLFKPYLYCGSIYYMQDQFDSALIFYKQAEKVINKYPVVVSETERLYNTFGNMYLSMGNYRQSKNYFEKAIAVLPRTHPYYKALFINYKINLATSLTSLNEYSKADSIYQSILPFNISKNEILHNIGLIKLYTGNNKKALEYFREVNYSEINAIELYNDFAEAFAKIGSNDSAGWYFDKATEANNKFNGTRRNVAHGVTLKGRADLLIAGNKYEQAIGLYQQAIMQFDPAFTDKDVKKNPGNYSGVFSYINLFNTLTAKGDGFRLLYTENKKTENLAAALDAYRSAFELIAYVEKTYDSDEARLFLNRIKYTIHNTPIDISIELYELTKNKNYLEDAYLFDQRNKASVLTLNVQENVFKNENTQSRDIFTQQAAIKSSITRLSLKAAGLKDSVQTAEINEAIRDYEIQLSKVQDKINLDPAYARFRSNEKIPSVADLQSTILDSKTALLSYHLSKKELLVFCIRKESFAYNKVPVDSNFFVTMNAFINALHNVSGETNAYKVFPHALYKTLFLPLQKEVHDANRLIIIPEDELNAVPFEALQDEKGNYLVMSFAIQYQYSSALLSDQSKSRRKKNTVFAMAPFAANGYDDTSLELRFSRLKNSLPEVESLPGQIYINEQATKSAFLREAGNYGIIHLATHASVDNEFPERSFIAFYPDSKDNLLYAQEIYDLNLDSTSLIVLSACETGTGRLIHGEGMMSLSRAFAYAGCPNAITSLWKAEDKTTAYLSGRLHGYLENGYTRDRALQQAKIDLLNEDKIPKRFKSPECWAHLILIDSYEAVPQKSSARRWIILLLLIGIAGYFIYKRRSGNISSK